MEDLKLEIKQISDGSFQKYGKIITEYDCTEILKKMEETPLLQDVVYVPSVTELESLKISKELSDHVYGQMPIQIGYCNGHNTLLNAVEYHRDSEINIAVTDLVLILGRQQDITMEYEYDTAKMEAFFVPAKTMVEVYATTLHYAPCHVREEGFRCVVVLPKGTNEELLPINPRSKEDQLLFAKNKWLIGHKEGGLPKHAYIGLTGKNLSL